MLRSLSKKETKEILSRSKPIMNRHSVMDHRDPKDREFDNLMKMSSVTSWHHCHFPEWKGGYPNSKITRQRLINIIGIKPNAQFMSWVRNTVWGLDLDGAKFLMFNSTRGTSFAVDRDCTDAQVQSIVDYLFQVLAKGVDKLRAYKESKNA